MLTVGHNMVRERDYHHHCAERGMEGHHHHRVRPCLHHAPGEGGRAWQGGLWLGRREGGWGSGVKHRDGGGRDCCCYCFALPGWREGSAAGSGRSDEWVRVSLVDDVDSTMVGAANGEHFERSSANGVNSQLNGTSDGINSQLNGTSHGLNSQLNGASDGGNSHQNIGSK
jgi:hypothetical protein